ncbi:solute carrier family 23 member 1-like isoform X2 [Glandiceps talaboti]
MELHRHKSTSKMEQNGPLDTKVNIENGDDGIVEMQPLRTDDREQSCDDDGSGNQKSRLAYRIDDVPSWYLCVFLGLQHYLTMFGGTLSIPLLLSRHLCIGDNFLATSQILSTILFVSGFSTFLQTTFGVRLPILQGGTFAFLIPTIAILSLPQWKCPETTNNSGHGVLNEVVNNPCFGTNLNISNLSTNAEYNNLIVSNISNVSDIINGSACTMNVYSEDWKPRMREIQGAIMVASCFQVLCGFGGVIGILIRFIGPLSIAPTITLVGLSLVEEAAVHASKQWGIAVMTMALILIFSQYLRNVKVPFCAWKKQRGCKVKRYTFFTIFPVILAISISWVVCVILTATNVFPNDKDHHNYNARTDARIRVLEEAPWFWFPLPGQWGTPTVSIAAVLGMVSGVLASMIESVGDYYACARMSEAPTPPIHAINRGIGVEGICCILAGLWGSGNGTTSYSENIGAIGITKVGSRRVLQYCSAILLVFGVFGKLGAFFTTIPEPVVGGVLCVMFGMISAVGISNLQFVDMNSSRNLCIFGFSLFCGLMVPIWLEDNPHVIQTGNTEVDEILTVLLRNSIFVGGLLGLTLDNTIPGTKEERGLLHWHQEVTYGNQPSVPAQALTTYDFPFGMSFVRRWKFARYLPFCPTFAFGKQRRE